MCMGNIHVVTCVFFREMVVNCHSFFLKQLVSLERHHHVVV